MGPPTCLSETTSLRTRPEASYITAKPTHVNTAWDHAWAKWAAAKISMLSRSLTHAQEQLSTHMSSIHEACMHLLVSFFQWHHLWEKQDTQARITFLSLFIKLDIWFTKETGRYCSYRWVWCHNSESQEMAWRGQTEAGNVRFENRMIPGVCRCSLIVVGLGCKVKSHQTVERASYSESHGGAVQ